MLDRAPRDLAAGFIVSVVTDPANLPKTWPSAGALGEAQCHVFQTREFVEIWCRTYGPALKAWPSFVTVHTEAGEPLLMIPFATIRQGGARVLTFMDSGVADYNAPILFPTMTSWTSERALQLWVAIEAALPPYDIALLSKMPMQVGNLDNPLALLADEPDPEACHGNVLTRPWADVEASQPHLKELKRKRRGLERLGPLQFVVAETAAEQHELFEVMAAQKQRRFEETSVPGFDAEPHKRDFFELGTTIMGAAGALHLCALKVGDTVVATAWGLKRGTHVYDLMIGFEAGEWKRYSPGRALNLMLLQWLHERGYTYLDHGIGNEPWKLQACENTVPLVRRTIVRTPFGRMFALRMAAMTRLRATKIWQKLRPLKWALLRRR